MDKIEKIRQEIERQLSAHDKVDHLEAFEVDKAWNRGHRKALDSLLSFLDTLSEEPDKSLEEAPDKIYLGIDDMGSGYVYSLSLDNNGHPEYIRKDALLEYINKEGFILLAPKNNYNKTSMAKEAYIVWAFGEDNTYSYRYRDLVGVFTNFRAMFKALRKDGITKQQIADFRKQNPYNKFININVDYEKDRDSSSYCFEAITLNE